MTLFIKEALRTPESAETPIILREDWEDTLTSFTTYAERKLKGFSVGEIDHLATKAKDVDSEVKKRDVLERIEDALKDARKALADTNKADKQKELRIQIQVLGELKTKVNAFKVTDDEPTKTHDNKLNLDEV